MGTSSLWKIPAARAGGFRLGFCKDFREVLDLTGAAVRKPGEYFRLPVDILTTIASYEVNIMARYMQF